MNEIMILNDGFADSLDLLSDDEMDFVKGGLTHCGKGYSLTSAGIKCKCNYDGPDVTTKPDPVPNPFPPTINIK